MSLTKRASVVSISLGMDIDFKAMGIQSSDLSYCPTNDIGEFFSGQTEKAGLMVRIHSPLDPDQAPPGKSTVGIVACFPYDFKDYWKLGKDGQKGKEYEALKEDVAAKLIASMEKVVPGLSEHIVYKRIATPITFERATLNSGGQLWAGIPCLEARCGVRRHRSRISFRQDIGLSPVAACRL